MQGDPYWPLNNPSFFRYRDSESRCSRYTKADVGIGPKFGGPDGIPTSTDSDGAVSERQPRMPFCESSRRTCSIVASIAGGWPAAEKSMRRPR